MNLQDLKSDLEKIRWKNVEPGSQAGVDFDLFGKGRFWLKRWNILVKVIPVLDSAKLDWCQQVLEALITKQGFFAERAIMLCFIAGKVAPDVKTILDRGELEMYVGEVTSSRYGIMAIADEEGGSVYTQVPRIPDVAYRVGTEVTGILERLLGQPQA